MKIQTNTPLSYLTTMQLGGPATVVTCTTRDDIEQIVQRAKAEQKPYFVLGGGSNVIASDNGFAGYIILNRIAGFDIIDSDETSTTVRVGAGENWDHTVAGFVDMRLSGCEAMSAIPGTVGATPVQNVGAYGQEIADTLVELEAYDTDKQAWVTLDNAACRFSYRNSIFKDTTARHHIIANITLRLRKTPMQPPFYDSLQRYLDTHSITDYSPASIRQAVVAIRADKLPDPAKIPNTGSFFKNPIVERAVVQSLLAEHPNMPHFPLPNGDEKLAAGWLIEQSGLKGYAAHGFATHDKNALVVVNRDARHYDDLQRFAAEIVDTVRSRFGVTLSQEPEILPFT